MKKAFTLFVSFFISSILLAQGNSIVGTWKGGISAGGQTLPIVIHFSVDASGAVNGNFDSPLQGATGIALERVVVNKDSVHFESMGGSAMYAGARNSDTTIIGYWSQNGAAFPLNLHLDNISPIAVATLSPFRSEKQIAVSGGKIYGELYATQKEKSIVLIVAGSGPTDRDGNSPMGVKANSYRLLADTLFKHHIATFRYDKRGIGKSTTTISEKDLRFDTYVQDLLTVFQYLKDSLQYENIYIAGHSEGSLLGLIAAQQLGKKLSGLISISGAGEPIDITLNKQLGQQGIHADTILNSLKKGKEYQPIAPELSTLFRPSIQPYLISWIKYDPAKIIATLQIPVMIEQGDCDRQVMVADAQILAKANPRAVLHIIPHMTHLLKKAKDDCSNNLETYTDPSLPIDPILAKDIIDFVKK